MVYLEWVVYQIVQDAKAYFDTRFTKQFLETFS